MHWKGLHSKFNRILSQEVYNLKTKLLWKDNNIVCLSVNVWVCSCWLHTKRQWMCTFFLSFCYFFSLSFDILNQDWKLCFIHQLRLFYWLAHFWWPSHDVTNDLLVCICEIAVSEKSIDTVWFFKASLCYFLSNVFFFLPNDSSLKTVKNVFYFIKKICFVLEIFKFL